MKAGEEKDRAGAEEELHGACRGHRRRHGGEDHCRGKLVVQLLQGKEHPRERGVEDCRQPGAGSAGEKILCLRAVPCGSAAHALGRGRADLHRRTGMTEGEPGPDGERAAEDLHTEDAEPAQAEQAQQGTLHLRDAASRGHGIPPAERRQQEGQYEQPRRPRKGGEVLTACRRVCGDRCQHGPAGFGLNDEEAVQRDGEACRHTSRGTQREEPEPEPAPPDERFCPGCIGTLHEAPPFRKKYGSRRSRISDFRA